MKLQELLEGFRGDPRYPMELFQRVITVSLEAMRIVNALPRLEID